SGWNSCVSWYLGLPASPCLSTLPMQRLPRPRCETWKRLRVPRDCQSRFLTPAPAARSMPPSRGLCASEQMPYSSATTPISSAGACNSPVTFPLSALRRALGDDVDDLKRHHYFAGLIVYLDERGDRTAIGL